MKASFHPVVAGMAVLVGLALTLVAPGRAAAAPADYTIVGSTQKVLKNATVNGTTGASLAGARNEFVSFQVVLRGGTGGQTGVSVTPGAALTGPGGTIPNANLTIYREDYYTTTQASSGGRFVGAWPDVLIPAVDRLYGQTRRAFPVDVPAGQTRVAFVDLLVPANQTAGGYDGSVVVANNTGGSATVPVHLDVRNFTLPSTSSLRSLWSLNWIAGCNALYGNCDAFASEANEQRAWRTNYDFARLALDDRMTIANPQFQPPASSGEVAHFNSFMLPLINGTAPTQLAGAKLTAVSVDPGFLSAWKSLAQTNGFTDRALTYDTGNCDEPDAAKWSRCRAAVNGYKATWPGLPNVMTTNINAVSQFDPSLSITDILVPVVDQMDDIAGTFAGDQHANYASFLSHPGKQVWMYTSCDVSGCGGANESDTKFARPWMDYTIDTQAAQNRSMGWLDYVYNATGELYYATTQQLGTAWTNQWGFGGNGDGTLYYPGTLDRIGGTTPIPLESFRMKMIRNGYQDYEYLRLATQAGHGPQALAIAKSVYPSTHQANPSQTALDSARAQLADLIDPASRPPLEYTGAQLTQPVTVDGQLGEYASLPSIQFAGSNNTTVAKLGWDTQNLYAAFSISDTAINVNQTGRDGELWNGDSVEIMIDRNGTTRPTTQNTNDYHVLVNSDNALTDERGTGSGWDRSFTANASTAVVRTTGGYTVEIAVPWTSIGGAPTQGTALGLDVANNDSDTAGQVTPYDWANLTRFAQPQAWGTFTIGGPAMRYTASRVGAITVDGQLGEYAGVPAIQFVGSNNTTVAKLGWDGQNLYAAFSVSDSVVNVNQTGRDGELWNGDGVEVMIDRNGAARPAVQNANDYHVLVNSDNALTDERGTGSGWDRSFTANALTAVVRTAGGYTVEIAVPWASIGGVPAQGAVLGLDVANNDSDTAGQVTPYDWANLTRFAQPQAWGTLVLG